MVFRDARSAEARFQGDLVGNHREPARGEPRRRRRQVRQSGDPEADVVTDDRFVFPNGEDPMPAFQRGFVRFAKSGPVGDTLFEELRVARSAMGS